MKRYFLILIVIVLSFCMTSCRSFDSDALSSEIEYVTSEIWIDDSETKSGVESDISDKNVISKNEFHYNSEENGSSNKIETAEQTAQNSSMHILSDESAESNSLLESIETKPKHIHNFSPQIIEPTCGEKGYTTYKCECGFEGHKENFIPATKIHTFNKKHKCTVCGFVCTISGNISGNYNGNEPVKYYISKSYGELVIFGNGTMPQYYRGHAPWHASDYFDSIKTIIITDNVTNISSNAFSVDMPNVKTLVIGDSVKKIESSSITGLHLDELKIGANVETISRNSMMFYKLGKIYLPKSAIKVEDFPLNNKVFYQGSKEELYNITVWDTETLSHMTLKEKIDKYSLTINVDFNAW